MYPVVLSLHSLCRWLALAALLFSLIRSYRGLLGRRPWTGFDNTMRHTTATILHIQLILGIWLYFISPLTGFFLHHYQEAVHERSIRFFGMEHSTMMLAAIVVATIGSALAKRKPTAPEKFRTMAVWFSLSLVIILMNIP